MLLSMELHQSPTKTATTVGTTAKGEKAAQLSLKIDVGIR